jgi:hypothetical protein
MKWGADLSPSCEGWSQTHQWKRLLPVLYYANKGFKLLKNFVKKPTCCLASHSKHVLSQFSFTCYIWIATIVPVTMHVSLTCHWPLHLVAMSIGFSCSIEAPSVLTFGSQLNLRLRIVLCMVQTASSTTKKLPLKAKTWNREKEPKQGTQEGDTPLAT